jgi:hypothetical protein
MAESTVFVRLSMGLSMTKILSKKMSLKMRMPMPKIVNSLPWLLLSPKPLLSIS